MIKPLAKYSDDELVMLFAEKCLAQDDASSDAVFAEENSERHEALARCNEVFQAMREIDAELRKRGPSSRLTLTKLYDHPNPQVRLHAAKCSLAVASVKARRVIEAIAQSGVMPHAGDAAGTIRNLDSGFWKPS